ncbi:MAG: hypothetical protein OEY49_11340 [Candidatus Heimdallarchaeota archaeon]|nr:hypothetical protein [Candidatus Heimdallarchaeota archaeon]
METVIPYKPDITTITNIVEGKWGVIFAHGEKSRIEEGFFPILANKLNQKNISVIRFTFPFTKDKSIKVDDIQSLDQAFLKVWEWTSKNFPDKKWCVGGHDIGGETSIRISSITGDFEELPPVICINYPMYPHNKPELFRQGSIGALMGDGLFCQSENSSKGTYDRLKNQLAMMANHAIITKIVQSDHEFNKMKHPINKVMYWIAKDIEKFLTNIDKKQQF